MTGYRERQGETCTDGRGKHPSDGLAGKIQATQSTAPDDVDWRAVLRVAWVAWDTDTDPARVWARECNHEITDEWGRA